MSVNIRIPMEELRKRSLFFATPCYGGVCHAMFARSLADLSAHCARSGIGLQIYFLINESLIPRARNYCLPADAIVDTEDGPRSIEWIVSSRYAGRVLSSSEDGKLSWNRVVNSWKRPLGDKTWVRAGSGRSKGHLVATSDHQCAIVADPLAPLRVEYVPAANLVGRYVVRRVKKTKDNRSSLAPLYNQDQLQLIIGTLLGDGHVNGGGTIAMGHGAKQVNYLRHKTELLNGGEVVESTGGFGTTCYVSTCYATEQTKLLRSLMYGTGRKSPLAVLPYVGPAALAYWYMDDGHLMNGKQAQFCTQGFTLDENRALAEWFKNRWEIEPEIRPTHEGRLYQLHFDNDDSEKLFEIIAPYVHSDLEYKLAEKHREGVKKSLSNKRLDVSLLRVKTVSVDRRVHSDLYDIEVENDHNFFADGFLVHNCVDEFMRSNASHMLFIDADIHFDPRDVIAMLAMMGDETDYDIMAAPYPKKSISWEKIKAAVDKGFADTDPGVLERFVGDYVFNPLPGTANFRIDEPVEVLEAGTGFMMFRRKTFERFRDAYPEYWYRPDHVRTEHFDGSREVFMYFQAEIDRTNYEREYRAILEQIKAEPERAAELVEKALSIKETRSKRYLSEDYWHNQRARAIGLKTWLCPWMKTTHTGSFVFGGSLADLAQLGASPTADVGVLSDIRKKKSASQ